MYENTYVIILINYFYVGTILLLYCKMFSAKNIDKNGHVNHVKVENVRICVIILYRYRNMLWSKTSSENNNRYI